MTELLTVKNLCKSGILKDISFSVKAGEMVAIMGPSGSGKSTLLYQVSGMDRADSGEVWMDGTEICGLSEDDRARLRLSQMGFVFQQMNMLKNLNLLDNILLPACHLNRGKTSGKELECRARMLMEKMGIAELAERKITEVSGGQLQRACICRSMMNQPKILFADEPTGALDSETSVQIMEILKEISKEKLIIMVTHNPELAEKYSTRIIRMLDGEIKDDSMPLTEEEVASASEADKIRVEQSGRVKKPSMSFATSFGLSLKNLFTKKGRTALLLRRYL